jgi:transglutaminase-like putative cysteine protease
VELLRVDGAGLRVRRDDGMSNISVELEITHTTRYEFSQSVFLDPHSLRFQPRADGGQLPLEFELEIEPSPVGQSSHLDAAGNVVTSAWFEGLHESLSITAHSEVAMLRDNPFDYLPDASRSQLPVFYGEEADALRPYLRREATPAGCVDEVAVFAARMRAAARGELLPLLGSLNQTMFERLTLIRREEGDAWSPMHTWREKCGACRDLAWLFVDVCRAAGVAARFVSGYEDSVLGR